jgi:hypothetical protein
MERELLRSLDCLVRFEAFAQFHTGRFNCTSQDLI